MQKLINRLKVILTRRHGAVTHADLLALETRVIAICGQHNEAHFTAGHMMGDLHKRLTAQANAIEAINAALAEHDEAMHSHRYHLGALHANETRTMQRLYKLEYRMMQPATRRSGNVTYIERGMPDDGGSAA